MIRPFARNLICALLAIFTLLAASAQAQLYQNILTFDVDGNDGSVGPYSALVQGTDGRIYGTGFEGYPQLYLGSVYGMTADGAERMVYNFCSQQNCPDGSYPQANVVEGPDGNFYGTTSMGGANTSSTYCRQGCGTVYRVTPDGDLTTLYSFCSLANCADGVAPVAGLVEGVDGNLYGTTSNAGASGSGGTIFKITPAGTLTTLYSFCSVNGCFDGEGPSSALLQAPDGNFYGTTPYGGMIGYGTIFQVTPAGVLTTVHNFCTNPCDSGGIPSGPLTQGADGNFYGTTSKSRRGYGTVYKFSRRGKLTTLYTFCFERRRCTDGAAPETGVTLGSDGYLYGTTKGADNQGSLFAISPAGNFYHIRTFYAGGGVTGGLLQGTDGLFYGYCVGGLGNPFCAKDDRYGNVFTMNVGLKPFVKTSPVFGPEGAAVKILGSYLLGATAVTFNGATATFKVVSASEITTNVPAGATSGRVEVTTRSGTLTSNLPFTITQ